MCWKTSQSAPEPIPAMSFSSVTEATQLEGVLSCSENTHSCNSTVTICYNDGLLCCLDHEPKTKICICLKDWEPPYCLTKDIFLWESRGLEMGTAGIAGIIVFIVIVVLAIVITAVVLVARRQRRLGQCGGGTNEGIALNHTADEEKNAQGGPVRGANGSDRNGS